MQPVHSSHGWTEEHWPSPIQHSSVLMQPLHPNDVPHPPLAEYTKQTCLFTLQVLHRNAEESEKMLDPNTDKSLIYFSLSQGPPLPNIS